MIMLVLSEPAALSEIKDIGTPFIRNFSKLEYRAGTQNWDIAQDQKGLMVHAWDESRSQRWCDPATGKSHYPWSRSMGWYTMAILDILDYLPQNHHDRDILIIILQKTCDALLKFSDPATGLYYQVLDQGKREGNYLDKNISQLQIKTSITLLRNA